MSASRPCEECGQVKRCDLYARATYRIPPEDEQAAPGLQRLYAKDFHEERTHLCRPCARALGYTPRPRAKRRPRR